MFQSSGYPVRGRLRTVLLVGIPLLTGVIFFGVSFGMRSQAALSSYVQGHGMERTAVIQSVNNIKHTTKKWVGTGSTKHQQTSTSYTAEVLVRLAAPVGGQTQTTVHVPDYERNGPGATLTVLVDPKDPSYAELPGSPVAPAILPTIFLILGSVLIVIAVVAGVLIACAHRRGTTMTFGRTWQRSWSSQRS